MLRWMLARFPIAIILAIFAVVGTVREASAQTFSLRYSIDNGASWTYVNDNSAVDDDSDAGAIAAFPNSGPGIFDIFAHSGLGTPIVPAANLVLSTDLLTILQNGATGNLLVQLSQRNQTSLSPGWQ